MNAGVPRMQSHARCPVRAENNNRLLCKEGSCMASDNNDEQDLTYAVVFTYNKMPFYSGCEVIDVLRELK